MKYFFLHIAFFYLLLLQHTDASAKIVLPNFFGDNMVLQQQTSVAIWGKGMLKSIVTINTSWNKKTYKVKSDNNGFWKAFVVTPKAGGPYTITIADTGKIMVSNVLIGEVWFCSGQSNMEMPLKGFPNQPVLHANDIISAAGNPMLRLFKTERNTAAQPTFTVDGHWEISSTETVKAFSAVAYQFGEMLQQKLSVPVGIIVSSWGGTRIQSWMSASSLALISEEKIPENLDTVKEKHKKATTLYNGMIAPFVGYGIKGFLWYQGESNRHEPAMYEKLFPEMVRGWRNNWTADTLPFYYVQIAPYGSKDSTKSVRGLREAQLHCLNIIPNSGMVVTMDIGTEEGIHPPDKTTVSKRLLYWALQKDYHFKGIDVSGPIYKSISVEKDKIKIEFDYADNGLTTYGKEFTNLEIAGEDKVFFVAKGKIESDKTLTVWNEAVAHPIAVRYGYKDFVVGELFNTAGLPASSFRTDNW